MSAKDIIKKSVIENFTNTRLSVKEMIMLLGISVIIGLFIFVIYKLSCKTGFYSKAYNISLILMPVITATIIITIQSSVVVSLGMVGALSIVRFRTALKNPLDLVFMFWSISVGIVVGAGLPLIAIILSLVVAIVLLVFNSIPLLGRKKLLNVTSTLEPNEIDNLVNGITPNAKRKSLNYNGRQTSVLFEISSKDTDELFKALKANEKISGIQILESEDQQF